MSWNIHLPGLFLFFSINILLLYLSKCYHHQLKVWITCFYLFSVQTPPSHCWWKRLGRGEPCLSEGLTLCVLCGAHIAVALQSHGIVVERGDVRLAAGQPGGHVATAVVRAHTVVTVDVGGFWYRLLQGSHTHIHTQRWITGCNWRKLTSVTLTWIKSF